MLLQGSLELESIRKKHSLVFTLCFKHTTPPLMTEKQMILIDSNVRSVVMRKAYCIRRYDLSLKMMIC